MVTIRRKRKLLRKERTPSTYGPADYISPGALDALRRAGKHKEVEEIISEYGDSVGDATTMDPLDLLILAEEHDEQT